jgi:competence protein ComEC
VNQAIVVSAGEGNNYGHPNPGVLESAAKIGAAVLCTDELGSVEVISDRQSIWWMARDSDSAV